ncbi:response regulator [candidate division KSB1 bacterium]|nr:response regulator [candidate division KSB1 bacterium]
MFLKNDAMEYIAGVELCRDMDRTITEVHHSFQSYFYIKSAQQTQKADSLNLEFSQLLNRGLKISTLNIDNISKIQLLYDRYYNAGITLCNSFAENQTNVNDLTKIQNFNFLYSKAKNVIAEIIGEQEARMRIAFENTQNSYGYSTYYISAIIFVIIVVFSVFSYYLTRSIINPLREVVDAANKLANGDIDVILEINSQDEISELKQAFASLINVTHYLTDAANAIGQGNYTHPIKPRGRRDKLGQALLSMQKNLVEMSDETKSQNWLKTGLAELNDSTQGVQKVSELAQNIITFLCNYMKVQIGAIYLFEKNEVLKLTGTYAYNSRKQLSDEFRIGEGIIGQAAMEKQHILITNVPENYSVISSGLGEAVPRHLVVLPFYFENQLIGVLELGSFESFDNIMIEFLKQTAEKIAIAIHTSQSQHQVKELLHKYQLQAKKLEEQQEVMKQINEELEEQTRYLKESEARLQLQQQELQQTNDALEDKTQELERQKADIQKKNQQLEETRQLLEMKAKDLELTSRFKSEFLANMSHELRTPLNSLLILSKLLQDNKDGNLTDKQIEFAKTIHGAGSDLLMLINDILDLSKVESGKMDINIDHVNVAEFVDNIKRIFTHVAEDKGLYFKTEIDPNLPKIVQTDKFRVEQIIRNFMSNAFKFTSNGGVTLHLFTSTTNSDDDSEIIPRISIAVADSGKGIAKDKQKLIFEAFQQEDGTTSRKYGGTGLGLSISKELARLLDGEITIESESGKGSTFTLHIPITWRKGNVDSIASLIEKTDKNEAEIPITIVDDTHLSKDSLNAKQPITGEVSPINDDRNNLTIDDKTLLIIDDDDNSIDLISNYAHEKEYKCLVAKTGQDGVALAQRYQPNAIILDIGLPVQDGIEVLSELKDDSKTRHIPVHLISGSEKFDESRRMGSIGFLQKPASVESLNLAFTRMEGVFSKQIKKLLIIEDDIVLQKSMIELVDDKDIQTAGVTTGEDALKLLREETFDCMVVDLGLNDMSGFELIRQVREDEAIPEMPIIVHTGRDLTVDEKSMLNEYAERIIIKGTDSLEHLLDETALFLHRVEADLAPNKQKVIRMLHEKEMVFEDKTFLIVDDDMRNVFALTHIIEGKGAKVVVGKNGREGLSQLDEHPEIDIVLMDIMMPEMDGYEAMRHIRMLERFKSLPIIALTANIMKEDREKCIEAGANDYMAKPIQEDKLLALIKKWL